MDVETQDEEVGPQSVDNFTRDCFRHGTFGPEYGRYSPRRSTRSCHPQEVVTQSVPQTVDTVTVATVHTVGLQGEECCASASSPVLDLPLPLTLAG